MGAFAVQAGIDAGRFVIREELGRGAQGTVHRAHDRRRGADVALKLIPSIGSRVVLELKHEFRMAAALSHPHLVRLYELFSSGSTCYFTMELIDGVPLDQWMSGRSCEAIRRIGGELVEAVHALHLAHRLHRDIKPANLLVSDSRGLVVLDFGFASMARARHGDGLGSPVYVAPELLWGADPTEASDWFSVGAVLWEILTDRAIARGPAGEPPPMATPCPEGIDEGLWRLTKSLVASDPAERPTGAALLEFFGRRASRAHLIRSPGEEIARHDVVGRPHEFETLRRLHDEAASDSRIAWIIGASGIGKTALALAFLDEVPGGSSAFRGRCGPREDVPYNALDELMDGAARRLLDSGSTLQDHIAPHLSAAITRIFPVFSDVAGSGPQQALPQDGDQVLRLAARAFLDLVSSMTTSTPIIWLDDLQWADRDSTRLLALLLDESSSSKAMILLGSRSEPGEPEASRRAEVLRLGPLSLEESLELAASWVGEVTPRVRLVAEECGGSPLFLRQIVDQMATGGDPARLESIEEAIEASLTSLPAPARRLAEFIAVVGRPVPGSLVGDSPSELGGDPYDYFLLHDQRLLRGSGTRRQEVEIYHDRIREVLLSGLPADRRRALHLRAASFLEQQSARAEEVLFHFVEGGRPQDGVSIAVDAAEAAARTYAFSRAADLYALVLDLPELAPDMSGLVERMAFALSRAGRAEEAANAYLDAASMVDAERSVDLRRRASEEFLRIGQVSRGLDVLGGVLADLGLPNPSTWIGTLIWLARNQLGFGAGVRRRSHGAADLHELRRIDACFSAGLGLNMIDVRRSMLFQALQLTLARRSGDPTRISRALAVESTYLSTRGSRGGDAMAADLLRQSKRLATDAADPEALAFANLCAGVGHTVRGDFRNAISMLDDARERFRAHRDGVTWEVANCDLYKCWSSVYLGEFAWLRRVIPRLQREAEERSDVLAQIGVSSGIAVVAGLLDGSPEIVRRRADQARSRLPTGGFQSLDYFDLVAQTTILLYEGRGAEAYARIRAAWPRLRRGFFLSLRFFRVELRFLRGRCALAAALARTGSDRSRFVADALAQMRALRREPFALADAFADVLALEARALEAGDQGGTEEARAIERWRTVCPVLAVVSSDHGAGESVPVPAPDDPTRFARIWRPVRATSSP